MSQPYFQFTTEISEESMSNRHSEICSVQVLHIARGQRIDFIQQKAPTVATIQNLYCFASAVAKSIGKPSLQDSVVAEMETNEKLTEQINELKRKNISLQERIDAMCDDNTKLEQDRDALQRLILGRSVELVNAQADAALVNEIRRLHEQIDNDRVNHASNIRGLEADRADRDSVIKQLRQQVNQLNSLLDSKDSEQRSLLIAKAEGRS